MDKIDKEDVDFLASLIGWPGKQKNIFHCGAQDVLICEHLVRLGLMEKIDHNPGAPWIFPIYRVTDAGIKVVEDSYS